VVLVLLPPHKVAGLTCLLVIVGNRMYGAGVTQHFFELIKIGHLGMKLKWVWHKTHAHTHTHTHTKSLVISKVTSYVL